MFLVKSQSPLMPGHQSLMIPILPSQHIILMPPPDKPNEWELKARTLAFTNIEGDHGGANLANMIIRVVQKYGLVGKVGWATSDNASVNDKAMRVLQGIFHATPEGQKWLAKERRIR